jgi:hypothetical protein
MISVSPQLDLAGLGLQLLAPNSYGALALSSPIHWTSCAFDP